jgi:hypothetical protein
VAVRTPPFARFGVIVLIRSCGTLGYFLRSDSLGGQKENGLGAIRFVCEVHLEITKSVTDSPIDDICVQARAHGEAALSLLWLLTVIAPPV